MTKNRASGREGFTLVELLFVVVILGILAVMGIPQLSMARERAVLGGLSADLRNLAHSQERYFHANRVYTAELELLDFGADETVVIEVTHASPGGWAAVARHVSLGELRGCAVMLGAAVPPELPDGRVFEGAHGTVQCTD